MSKAWTTVQRRRSAHGLQTDLAETIRRALVNAGAMSHPRKSNRAVNKFGIIEGGIMPNGAIRYDEWLCTCGKRNFMQTSFCRECGEQPTKTQKQQGAGGNGKDGGASPRQAPPKSPTPSASGETTKTTNNDTRRKVTLLEEAAKTARELGDEDMLHSIEKKLQDAKVEHADARPIGAQLDSAIAIAAKKNAAVKESLKEGEKEVLSPIELELSEVIKQFEDGERGCANGQCGPRHPNGVLGGRRKALDKRGKHATKRSCLPRNSGQQEETQQLNNFDNATPAEQMMEWRRTKHHQKRSWEQHKKGQGKEY